MRIIATPLQKFDSSLRNFILFPTSATISLLPIIIFYSLIPKRKMTPPVFLHKYFHVICKKVHRKVKEAS